MPKLLQPLRFHVRAICRILNFITQRETIILKIFTGEQRITR